MRNFTQFILASICGSGLVVLVTAMGATGFEAISNDYFGQGFGRSILFALAAHVQHLVPPVLLVVVSLAAVARIISGERGNVMKSISGLSCWQPTANC